MHLREGLLADVAGALLTELAAFAEVNPVPAKWVMEQIGLLPSGHARKPLAPLADATKRRIADLLDGDPELAVSAAA